MARRKRAETPAPAQYTVIHAWGQNLRSGPGMEHPVLRVIPQGTTVNAAKAERNWVRVEDGWMDRQLMKEG